MLKRQLNTAQLINLNMGLLGVQFAWSLVLANTSGILTFLGARNNQLGACWIVPTIFGLVLPPIIGLISDKTQSSFGKRIPYIFVGALAIAVCMLAFPNSMSLVMAVFILSFFSASFNMASQPFKPLMTDIVTKDSQTKSYAIQTVMVGIGAIIASVAPWVFFHSLRPVSSTHSQIPFEVKYAFYIGAIIVLITIFWTSYVGRRYMSNSANAALANIPKKNFNLAAMVKTVSYIRLMPKLMWQVSLVQIFTWLGTFCFIVYFTPTIESTIYHVSPALHLINKNTLEKSTLITGLSSALYMFVNVVFAFCISILIKKISRKSIHIAALTIGGIALIMLGFVHHISYLFLAMLGVGIAWGSFNSIPFAMVASVITEEQMGFSMGLFNIAICLPQLLVSFFMGYILVNYWHNNTTLVIIFAGFCYILAAFITCFIKDKA